MSGDNKGAASRLFEDWQDGLGEHILQQRQAGKEEGEGGGRRRRRKGMARFDANFDGKEGAFRGLDFYDG